MSVCSYSEVQGLLNHQRRVHFFSKLSPEGIGPAFTAALDYQPPPYSILSKSIYAICHAILSSTWVREQRF